MSSFGCQRASAAPRSRLRDRAETRALVLPLALAAALLLCAVVLRCRGPTGVALLLAFGLRCGVGGDLLDESIREPGGIGDVAVLASVVARKFEQAPERARGVGVIVCEREAVALSALFGLPCLPVVLGRLRDRGQCSVGVLDRLRVVAELREHGREPVFCGRGERAAEAADAVGDRVHRLAIVGPLGAQHVVEYLAGGRGEGCGIVRTLAEPEGGQVCEERLVLRYPDEHGSAGERHPTGRDQLRRLVGETEQVEPVRDQALALADELRHLRRVAVLVGEAAVGAGLFHRG